MLAKVRDTKTNQEKVVPVKVYELLKKSRYELLGYVEDDGTTPATDAPSIFQDAPKTTKKKEVVEPVAKSKLTPEDVEQKKADIAAMNQKAIDAVKAKENEQEADAKSTPRPEKKETTKKKK